MYSTLTQFAFQLELVTINNFFKAQLTKRRVTLKTKWSKRNRQQGGVPNTSIEKTLEDTRSTFFI